MVDPRATRVLTVVAATIAIAGCASVGPRPTTPSLPVVSPGPAASPVPTQAQPTAAPPAATQPAVSGRILFFSNREVGHSFYVVNADGSGLTALPFAVATGSPALSPDGRSLAFATGGLSVANLDGTRLRTIAIEAGMTADEPAWAPDAGRIAVIEHAGGGSSPDARLAIVDLSSGHVTEVPVQTSGDRPGWSPDGSQIVYGNLDNGGLAVVTLASGAISRLTSGDDGFGSFSPDGRLLVFQRADPPDAAGTQTHHLFVAQADGSAARQLTFGAGDDEYPAWSPDGASIAFARMDAHGGWALWRIGLGDSEPVRVTSGSAADQSPTWGP